MPVDFTKSIKKKDSVNPSTGRAHAPGRTYRPLERFLPKLQSTLQAVCNAAIGMLRKPSSAPANPPTTASSSTPSTSKPAATPQRAGKKKARKANAKKRKANQAMLKKFVTVGAPNGIFIEDECGVVLVVLIRKPFGEGEEAERVNVSALQSTPTSWTDNGLKTHQAQASAGAAEFTNSMKPSKTSAFRNQWKLNLLSPFKAMACHFAMWWAIGQPVECKDLNHLPSICSDPHALRNAHQRFPAT